MAETLSVFRHENKYIVTPVEQLQLQKKLDALLERDDFSKEGTYRVRSLYFDSLNNIDFSTKLAGTEIRKKIRLRVYSPDADRVKLEVKQKNGDLQHKVSLWISRADATALMQMDYSVLLDYAEENPDASYIYTTMVMGAYRPVVLVEYDRIAYVYPLYSTRITFDLNIRSSETCLDLFAPEPDYVILQDQVAVLEVKFNEKLMSFISKTLKPYHLTQTSVSKYCMGRKIYYDFDW